MTTTQKITGCLLIMFFSYTCSSSYKDDYEEGIDIDMLTNYENLIHDSLVTMAIIKPEYQEIIQEVYGLETTVGYVYDYSYSVDEKVYQGTIETKDSFSLVEPVFYLKENPEFHSFYPEKELDELVVENESKENLYFSYFFLGICCLAFLGIIIAIVKSIKRRKKERIEHESKKAERVAYLNSLKNNN